MQELTNGTIRALDIVLSLAGLIALSPVILLLGLVGLADTGSPLFLQKRVGRSQELFTLVKFRTMRIGTASVGTHDVDRSSLTKFGKVLRRTKLDEIPQLLNVLHGDMSLVGPRPCLPSQTVLIRERHIRGVFLIRPGITGLAQVNKVDMSTPRRLARIDAILVRNLSLKCYAGLILATVTGKGFGDRVRSDS